MSKLWLWGCLMLLGAGWGLATPLTKIAVTAGYRPFGLIFWQLMIAASLLGLLRIKQGRGFALPRADLWFCGAIALIGTIIPNTASYGAAAHLPAGVMAVILAFVPIFAFPLALFMRLETVSWLRGLGLVAGGAGVVLLVQPEAVAWAPGALWWVPIALLAPFFYGLEGNVVAKWGPVSLSATDVLFYASLIGVIFAAPLAIFTGQFISPFTTWGAAEGAIVLGGLIHVVVYSGYVWLVRAAGSVFAAQVAYLVTAFGVGWSMLLLNESYGGFFWGALVIILSAVLLVRPKDAQ